MAQPHSAQAFAGVIYYGLGAQLVRQVAVTSRHTLLKILGIDARPEHVLVIVRLYHEIVAHTDDGSHLVGHVAYVCHQGERHAVAPDDVAHVLMAVVRHAEGRHAEAVEADFGSRLDNPHIGGINLLTHAIVVRYALVHPLGGVDGQAVGVAYHAHGLHVVGVVVCYDDLPHLAEAESVVAKVFLQLPYAYSGVDKEASFLCKNIVAVSAAAAAERYETKHPELFLAAKL